MEEKFVWHNEKRKINDLIPFQGNPRRMTEKQKNDLKESLKRFNLMSIPVINTDNVIISGHQRLKILQLLGRGKEEVDVRVPNRKLNDKELREANLRENKNLGEWEWDLLANFDSEMLLDVGFAEEELNEKYNLLGKEAKEDNFNVKKAVEEFSKPICKQGDMWQLGNHWLICGDSTRIENFERPMGNKKAKLCITSPPYNMGANMYRNYSDDLKSQSYIDFNMAVISNIKKVLAGFIFWNMSYNKNSRWEWIEIFYRIIKETGFTFLENIVWDKGHGLPIISKKGITRQYENILVVGSEVEVEEDLEFNFLGTNQKDYWFNKKQLKGLTNYWRIGTNNIQTDIHKACFPVPLVVKAIIMMTSRKDIIINPFTGTGSTLIGCEKMGRVFYGVELDEVYCDVIINRWEVYTGEKAVKINA